MFGLFQISDAVFLKLDGQVTVSVPEAVERKNMMGHFYSAWEIRENGVFATRKLTLNARTLSQTEIKLARQLRQAWEDAGEQAVVIE